MSQATRTDYRSHPSPPAETEPARYREGIVAREIEKRTAQVPSDVFLWAAGAAAIGSLALMLNGRRHASLFVGQWVPGILICGLYNKVVKTTGHDRQS